MKAIDSETQAFLLFEHKIIALCKSNWRFMEYEDRLSEASYIFIIALRTFPTNTGFFWKNYLDFLVSHMQDLKKEYSRQKCWISLDRYSKSKKYNACNCTLLDLLIAQEPDFSDMHVHHFMKTLSCRHQDILNSLMDGKSHRSLCRRLQINSAALRECLQEIGENYRDYSLGII